MAIGKSPAFIVRSEAPLCGGPPLDVLVERAETPVEHFFVRDHAPVPEVDPASYRLTVDGLVDRPLSLSLDDLRAFARHEAVVTLQCAGNRRDELIEVRPIPGEVPWGAEAIGTGRWGGLSLADILRSAGVPATGLPGAAELHVEFEGLDRVERGGRVFGFGASITLERALAGDVLVADRLGEALLPPDHGFPLRVVVPGHVGARSVKWLTRITVREGPSDNHFQAHAYKVLPPDADPHLVDWSAYDAIEEAPLHAVVASPHQGAALVAGTIAVTGYATGRGLHPVTAVEVAVVTGAAPREPAPRWLPAELLDQPAPGRWVRWRATLSLPPGVRAILARAHDASGVAQPESPAERWNPKGYSNDAWHRVAVQVRAPE